MQRWESQHRARFGPWESHGCLLPSPRGWEGLACRGALLPSRSKEKDAGSVAQAARQQRLPPHHPSRSWGPSQSVAGASLEKRGRKRLFWQQEAKKSPLAASCSVPWVYSCTPGHRAAQAGGLCQHTRSSIPAPSILWRAGGGGSVRRRKQQARSRGRRQVRPRGAVPVVPSIPALRGWAEGSRRSPAVLRLHGNGAAIFSRREEFMCFFHPASAQGSILREPERNINKQPQSCGDGGRARGSGPPSPLWGEGETPRPQSHP